MGKIDELIKQLCPKGVPMVTLDKVLSVATGKQLNKSAMISDAPYPVVNGGVEYSGYTENFNSPANSITISQGGASAGYTQWINCDFWAGAHCYVVVPYDNINKRYLFHVLKENESRMMESKQGAGIPGLNRKAVYSLEIPLPPLAIQKKIVEILDTFTGMIDNLQKELKQRQKQFEYYKEKWLTFEEGKATVMKVGDLFDFKNGLNKEKSAFGQGTSIVNYTDVYKHRGLKKIDLAGLVTLSDKEIERYRCLKGDVFFTRTSETKEEVGFPSVLLEDIENCTFSGFVLRARPKTSKLLPEYCKYCFFTYSFRKEVIKSATLTTRALTNGGSLSKIKISIPSLEKQQEIVDKLDTFEALISNIKQEIELRQKQYEFYREKLLTFE